MDDVANSPIDRFTSAVDLICKQLEAPSEIAGLVRKFDSLITLSEVITGKSYENPTEANTYLKLIEQTKSQIKSKIIESLGFTAVDQKKIVPLFISILESVDLRNEQP